MTIEEARQKAITAGLPPKSIDALIAAWGADHAVNILNDLAKQRQAGKRSKDFVRGDLLAAGKRAQKAGIAVPYIIAVAEALGTSNAAVNLLNGLSTTIELARETQKLKGAKAADPDTLFWGTKATPGKPTQRVAWKFWGNGQIVEEINAMAQALDIRPDLVDLLMRRIGDEQTHAILAATMSGSGARITFVPTVTGL